MRPAFLQIGEERRVEMQLRDLPYAVHFDVFVLLDPATQIGIRLVLADDVELPDACLRVHPVRGDVNDGLILDAVVYAALMQARRAHEIESRAYPLTSDVHTL